MSENLGGLFDPEAFEQVELCKGDRVTIQTIWGTEDCVVVGVTYDNGYPMVMLTTEYGDKVIINVARVRRAS